VILGLFSYNTRLLLLSGIGTPYDPLTGKGWSAALLLPASGRAGVLRRSEFTSFHRRRPGQHIDRDSTVT